MKVAGQGALPGPRLAHQQYAGIPRADLLERRTGSANRVARPYDFIIVVRLRGDRFFGDEEQETTDPDHIARDRDMGVDPTPVHERAVVTPQVRERESPLVVDREPSMLARDVRIVEAARTQPAAVAAQ